MQMRWYVLAESIVPAAPGLAEPLSFAVRRSFADPYGLMACASAAAHSRILIFQHLLFELNEWEPAFVGCRSADSCACS